MLLAAVERKIVRPYRRSMAEPGGDVLAGVLGFVAVALVPTVAFWLALRVPPLVRALARRLRRPSPVGPAGRPIEQLAADLRRVHRLLTRMPPGASYARRRGAEQAYEDLLAQAARMLGVDERLSDAGDRMDRELERLRVEAALLDVGLVIRSTTPGCGLGFANS